MRSVICHFYNEEYLLPWWLRHHRTLFDHGVLIDHGSSDASIDICREMVPDWRIVRSRHVEFDAFLTDHEVMEYELQLSGWKIALNVTEFLLPARPLSELETETVAADRDGFAVTGVTVVDVEPDKLPSPSISLPVQKHWGIDDRHMPPEIQERHHLGMRNRFYHRAPVGMYHPGRHLSWHPHAGTRIEHVYLFHYGYAPWTEAGIARKLQIGPTIAEGNRRWGWGRHHHRSRADWDQVYAELLPLAVDLAKLPGVGGALHTAGTRWKDEG